MAYLIRSKNVFIQKKKVGKLKTYALLIIWRKLLDEYIERFGFSENFLDIVRKQKEIALHKVHKIVHDDRSVNAFIKVAERELLELQEMGNGGDFWQSKAYIEKAMGFTIDPMRCSVGEFYSYFKIIEKKNKRTVTNE